MPMTEVELGKALDARADRDYLLGGTEFLGRPDTWYQAGKWRCINDHVVTKTLPGGAEYEGRFRFDLCPECRAPLRLTFPDDISGQMPKLQEFL